MESALRDYIVQYGRQTDQKTINWKLLNYNHGGNIRMVIVMSGMEAVLMLKPEAYRSVNQVKEEWKFLRGKSIYEVPGAFRSMTNFKIWEKSSEAEK